MKKFIIVYLAALSFVSCEKIIEPGDLPEQDARLVINSMIQKDSVFSVYLSSSKSIVSGKDYKTVDKAYCAIYEDGQFLEQLTFKSKGKYLGTKSPQAGKKYEIIARADGFAEVSGSATLPVLLEITKMQRVDSLNTYLTISQDPNAPGGGNVSLSCGLHYKVFVKELSDVREYFSVGAKILLYDTTGALITHTFEVNVNSFGGIGALYGSYQVLDSDETGVVAGEKSFDLSVNMYADVTELPIIEQVDVQIVAGRLSEDYYKYRTTCDKQASTSANFFAEPTIIYSNCSNGMGIVGASYYVPKVVFSRKFP